MPNVRGGAPAPERLHALDAVRGGALLLGIVFHASLSFVPGPTKVWIVEDNHRSLALAVLVFTTHVFRMTTFFLIAGFFAHMSFHRRGVTAFIGDRLKRIALPLAVGWPIVFGAHLAVAAWAANEGLGAPPPPFPTFPRFPLSPPLVSLRAAGVLRRNLGPARRCGLDGPKRRHPRRRRPVGSLVDARPAWSHRHGRAPWRCLRR